MSLADMIPGFAPTRTVEEKNGMFHVTVVPPPFMKDNGGTVVLTPDQYERYQMARMGSATMAGMLPELSRADLERLISGLSMDNPVWDE